MELELQYVRGIENCFVSLPLVLIQTLQSTRAGFLPPLLAIELRSSAEDGRWLVAWAGATSSSSTIEVAEQYAQCVSLPNHTNVQVRAAPNVAKATFVTIEPHSEDDWEILELNSEIAETVILKQVRIVHEGMRFPLWLPNHICITFIVVSTFPKKAVVQLVPGTEVAVAPKGRKKDTYRDEDSLLQSSGESNHVKALLRIQEENENMLQKTNVNGVELHVALTAVAYIHQETAKRFSIELLQLFALVPQYLRDNSKSHDDTLKVETAGIITDKKEVRHAIVCILVSDIVAKGHIMIARSVRRYLRAGLHSWVYLKGYGLNLKKEIPSLLLSPCQFVEVLSMAVNPGLEVLDGHENRKAKDMLPKAITDSVRNASLIDWSIHDEFCAAISRECANLEGDGNASYSGGKKSLEHLFRAWFLAQLNAIASNAGKDVGTLFLGNEALLHFEVKKYASGTCVESSNGSVEDKNNAKELLMEMLYVLRISEQTVDGGNINTYELSLDDECKSGAETFGKLNLGSPVSFYSTSDRASLKGFTTNISSLRWMETTVFDVINRLVVLLSPTSKMWFSAYNLPRPGHVLVHGPSGSGKTLLTKVVSKSLEAHEDILAHVVYVHCSELASEKGSIIQKAFSGFISDALQHAPSVVIFDDLDSLISASESDGSQLVQSVVTLTEFLISILDEYVERMKSSCGIGPIAFIATVQSPEKIPQSLSSSGRFDFHVQLASPTSSEREAILKHEIQRRSIQCADDILANVASKCDGYDAYDLGILVDRAVHAAVGRFLLSGFPSYKQSEPILIWDDFAHAMHDFLPVAMRDITKPAPDGGHSGWDDIGGLDDICTAIKEMIELPSQFPNIFAQAPLRLRSNVLLYGPPGCGKTHIVGAAAVSCSLRFISVKGPELLNKYIGASEQAVRDIFRKAAAAAPCLLFFDEFDSIAPKRGHDNTGVTDRVVNQFLTELDGVEVLTGVFVFAATSRPDLLDAALLRPGRLDRLLFCDFPSPRERLDILKVLSRKLPLARDVDLEDIAYLTEGFSGADLQALLSDAQLAAVHELLTHVSNNESGKSPIITNALLKSVASKARPSVSESEKLRLYNIYSQFLDSKRSITSQSRDAKGKRATLA